MSRQVKVKLLRRAPNIYGMTVRDCVVGKVYDATHYDIGDIKDIDGLPASQPGFQLVDEVGDKVFSHEATWQWEIVEG